MKVVMRIMSQMEIQSRAPIHLLWLCRQETKKEAPVPWYSNFPQETEPGEVQMKVAQIGGGGYPTASDGRTCACLWTPGLRRDHRDRDRCGQVLSQRGDRFLSQCPIGIESACFRGIDMHVNISSPGWGHPTFPVLDCYSLQKTAVREQLRFQNKQEYLKS